MPTEAPSETITIRLPREMRDRIKCLAEAEDLTISQLLRRHLRLSLILKKEAVK